MNPPEEKPEQRDEQVSNPPSSSESTETSLTTLLTTQRTTPNPQNESANNETRKLKATKLFLSKVRNEFKNQPQVYISILKEFLECENDDLHTAMQRFSNGIRGCPSYIIDNFNRLFPQYRINTNQRDPAIISVSSMESTETHLTLSAQQRMANAASSLQTTHRTNPTTASSPQTTHRANPTTASPQQTTHRTNPPTASSPQEYEYDEEMQVDEGSLTGSTEASPTSRSTTQTTVNPLTASSTCSAESSSEQSSVAQSSASESSSTESSRLQSTHQTHPPTAGSSLGSTGTSLTLSAQQTIPNPQNEYLEEMNNIVLSFWTMMRREFQPEVRTAFLNMIIKVKHGSIGLPEFMQYASNLFRGHPEISELLNRLISESTINPDQRDQGSISGSSLGSTGTSLTLSAQQRMANAPTASSLQTTHRANPTNASSPQEYEHDEEMQVDEGSLTGSTEASLTTQSKTQQATVNPSTSSSSVHSSGARLSSVYSSGVRSSAVESSAADEQSPQNTRLTRSKSIKYLRL